MADKKRLVDANYLRNKLIPNCPIEDGGIPLKDFNTHQRILELYPTEDAVEVAHGRWIHVPSSDMMTGKAYKCSECNKMRYGSYMPNYCQWCGAKMDGERKDNG